MLDMMREMDLAIENFRIEEKDENLIEVYTRHIVNGISTELSLSGKSSGTRKLFELLTFIVKGLVTGTTLVIDEMDAKIHLILLRCVVILYNNIEINKNGA